MVWPNYFWMDSEKGRWKIKMDCEQTIVYLMQYDTVLKYIDEDAVNFDTF